VPVKTFDQQLNAKLNIIVSINFIELFPYMISVGSFQFFNADEMFDL